MYTYMYIHTYSYVHIYLFVCVHTYITTCDDEVMYSHIESTSILYRVGVRINIAGGGRVMTLVFREYVRHDTVMGGA